MSPDPIARRNAGLRRISTITKCALAGGLILTGGLRQQRLEKILGGR